MMTMQKRILEAAAELFMKLGVRSVTMDEISETLGISKRTLYEHFSNKEELLKECILLIHNQHIERQKMLLSTVNNPLEIIHSNIKNAFKMITKVHPGFAKDIRKYHPKIWKEVLNPLRKENISFTREVICRGVEQDYFRSDLQPEIMSTLLHYQIQLMDELKLEKFSVPEIFEHIVMTFIRGIATDKGLKMINKLFNNEQNEKL